MYSLVRVYSYLSWIYIFFATVYYNIQAEVCESILSYIGHDTFIYKYSRIILAYCSVLWLWMSIIIILQLIAIRMSTTTINSIKIENDIKSRVNCVVL